jgi:hypothetical protein
MSEDIQTRSEPKTPSVTPSNPKIFQSPPDVPLPFRPDPGHMFRFPIVLTPEAFADRSGPKTLAMD